jgi:hypothetical protein
MRDRGSSPPSTRWPAVPSEAFGEMDGRRNSSGVTSVAQDGVANVVGGNRLILRTVVLTSGVLTRGRPSWPRYNARERNPRRLG